MTFHHGARRNGKMAFKVKGRVVKAGGETGMTSEISLQRFAIGLLQLMIGVHLTVGLVGGGVEAPIVKGVSFFKRCRCLVSGPPVGDGVESPVVGLIAKKLGRQLDHIFCRVRCKHLK